MSWFMATGLVVSATGNECAKIMPRTTNRALRLGIILAAEPLIAASEIWSSASLIYGRFISLGLTHGIEPFQKAAFDLAGVPPPRKIPSCPRRTHDQLAGIWNGCSSGVTADRSARSRVDKSSWRRAAIRPIRGSLVPSFSTWGKSAPRNAKWRISSRSLFVPDSASTTVCRCPTIGLSPAANRGLALYAETPRSSENNGICAVTP